MTLEWSLEAIEDREAIFAFVGIDSLRHAVSLDDIIELQADRLINTPNVGRRGRVAGTRELVLNGTPYIAAYVIRGEFVRILRVLHGARRWPSEIDTRRR